MSISAKEIPKAFSVISYEAKLTYGAGKVILSQQSGKLRCWIAD